jgi:hypothetical protein
MDNASWGALALALCVVAGIWTWYAFRHRGFAAGVRGIALTIIPIAAYLTHTLRMFGRIGSAISDWAAGFVFNPGVWIGVILGGVAVLLFVVSYKLPGGSREKAAVEGGETKKAVKRSRGSSDGGAGDALGDDLDDIQAILRKHGIS